ncbi:hypothetical protein Rvan_2153 [Rhodomicrobium vannielii ATCC 17100]|jgi:hypothetical protein|uniref:Uncharacterized protein n=1 Tax=Rhodomicrobium vannielii (strain ATCC 17100 / DSM 162 / LMG 4299 / NCIMB 10020 / ATH 3.1.1) TaxID=648757 RepID=E3I2L9_RHOVT|nr:DUF937 domain-containing protein [Rhodomicrobium vannielii]ADP71378.1 hypothetical protein Rvan_2153 [Rhodomicrobium vannielii ATCC 17100]
MKLFHIIAGAQNSRAFSNMGQVFGFSDEIMAQTVRYFIPPISKAIEKRAQTPDGLISILELLGSRRYDRFLDDPRIFGHPQVSKEGQRVLDFLFEREARLQKIVENRARVLPVDAATLRRLFPLIAVMVMGAVEVRTRRPLGVILHRVAKGETDDRAVANPFMALAQYLRKQEKQERDGRRRRLFSFFGVAQPAQQPAKAPAGATSGLFESA